jgi:hypothetical protein
MYIDRDNSPAANIKAAAKRSTPATQPTDVVKKPPHYTRWAVEPIVFIMQNDIEFWRGNIIKYVMRAGFKLYPDQDTTQSEITDLQKVIRYSEMRINLLRGNSPNDI